jgi:thermitase
MAGMQWAIDHNAKVISMSLGRAGSPNPAFQDLVNVAWNRGIIVVAAAGNSNSPDPHYPAYYDNVINVGASDRNDVRAGFSNFGPRVDVTAPGVDIWSTLGSGTYGLLSGTSMACPMVAGAIGTLIATIRSTLFSTAKPVGSWLHYGIVDMGKAAKLLSAVKLPLAPTSVSVFEGAAISGGLGSVAATDGAYLKLQAGSVPNLGQVASAWYRFSLPTTVSRTQVTRLDFSFVTRFANGATGQVYLLNWSTGKWDLLRAYALSSGVTTLAHSLKANFPTYLSGSGEYRVLVRGIMPTSVGITGNSFDTDYVGSTAVYINK